MSKKPTVQELQETVSVQDNMIQLLREDVERRGKSIDYVWTVLAITIILSFACFFLLFSDTSALINNVAWEYELDDVVRWNCDNTNTFDITVTYIEFNTPGMRVNKTYRMRAIDDGVDEFTIPTHFSSGGIKYLDSFPIEIHFPNNFSFSDLYKKGCDLV